MLVASSSSPALVLSSTAPASSSIPTPSVPPSSSSSSFPDNREEIFKGFLSRAAIRQLPAPWSPSSSRADDVPHFIDFLQNCYGADFYCNSTPIFPMRPITWGSHSIASSSAPASSVDDKIHFLALNALIHLPGTHNMHVKSYFFIKNGSQPWQQFISRQAISLPTSEIPFAQRPPVPAISQLILEQYIRFNDKPTARHCADALTQNWHGRLLTPNLLNLGIDNIVRNLKSDLTLERSFWPSAPLTKETLALEREEEGEDEELAKLKEEEKYLRAQLAEVCAKKAQLERKSS